MQAILISGILSFGQGLLIRFLSKEALKVIFVKVVTIIVKSTNTTHDDDVWEKIAPILSDFDKEPGK